MKNVSDSDNALTGKLSYCDVVAQYVEFILPGVVRKYEIPHISSGGMFFDIPARREAFNNFTDYLYEEGQITQEQYSEWGLPDELEE